MPSSARIFSPTAAARCAIPGSIVASRIAEASFFAVKDLRARCLGPMPSSLTRHPQNGWSAKKETMTVGFPARNPEYIQHYRLPPYIALPVHRRTAGANAHSSSNNLWYKLVPEVARSHHQKISEDPFRINDPKQFLTHIIKGPQVVYSPVEFSLNVFRTSH